MLEINLLEYQARALRQKASAEKGEAFHRWLVRAWEDAGDMGPAEFAFTHRKKILKSVRDQKIFFNDMMTERVSLEIETLTHAHDGILQINRLHENNIEDAMAMYNEGRGRWKHRNAFWQWPKTGLMARTEELAHELAAASDPTALRQKFTQRVGEIQHLIDRQGLFLSDEPLSVPYKGRRSTTFAPKSSALPHSDNKDALIITWRGAATLLYYVQDLKRVDDFGVLFPVAQGPLKAYQPPSPCALMLSPGTPHSGYVSDRLALSRTMSRAFMTSVEEFKHLVVVNQPWHTEAAHNLPAPRAENL